RAHFKVEPIPNQECVDVRFHAPRRGLVLAEVKPCEPDTARYAIRVAMGQLFDYQQRVGNRPALLIVLQRRPDDEDLDLATSNGFSVAYQVGGSFVLRWSTAESCA